MYRSSHLGNLTQDDKNKHQVKELKKFIRVMFMIILLHLLTEYKKYNPFHNEKS